MASFLAHQEKGSILEEGFGEGWGGGGRNFFPFRVDPFRIYVGSQNIYMVVSAPFCGFLSCSPRKRVYSRGGVSGAGGGGSNFFPFRVDPFRICFHGEIRKLSILF